MTRAEAVYQALRERIVTAALRPGARLIERDLAAEFAVSRIPLREALQRLANDGLVTAVPGQGSIVTVPTPKDLDDLFDVRAGLEPLAARLAAANAGPEALRACANACGRRPIRHRAPRRTPRSTASSPPPRATRSWPRSWGPWKRGCGGCSI